MLLDIDVAFTWIQADSRQHLLDVTGKTVGMAG